MISSMLCVSMMLTCLWALPPERKEWNTKAWYRKFFHKYLHNEVPYGDYIYTGWPRKNATILIINFKEIVNKTRKKKKLLGRKFISNKMTP